MVKRVIRMSPAVYINEPGILKQLPDLLKDNGVQSPLVLTDELVHPVIQPYLPKGFLEHYPVTLFQGSCTFEEIDRLSQIASSYDGLVAFGGGQLMDTAKVVADNLNIKTINIPTLPSNCACITTKSIIYSKNHEKVANLRHQKAVDLVLVEPDLLINAPYPYILSGIGDTLAKFYEIRRRITDDKLQQLSSKIGRFYLDICRHEMLAVRDIKKLSSQEIENLLDSIFLVAASVDGIADLDGRSVVAHAFYNAHVKLKGRGLKTHGEVVALGSLLQVILEGRESKFLRKEITNYHEVVGLPLKLADVGIRTDEEVAALAAAIACKSDSRVQSVFPNITVSELVVALEELRG